MDGKQTNEYLIQREGVVKELRKQLAECKAASDFDHAEYKRLRAECRKDACSKPQRIALVYRTGMECARMIKEMMK